MNIQTIQTNKFKTNEIAIFMSMPLRRETITKNALIPRVLIRGNQNLKNQLEISKKMEDMYGTNFNCGIDKTGDYCILKFYIQTIGNSYALENEDLANEQMKLITDIIFNPIIENNVFIQQYVEQEKENLLKKIESKKDDKENYAYNRCIEEMFKDEPYGIYKFGYAEDLKKINAKNLYEYYKEMIKNARIDLFICGPDAKSIELPDSLKTADIYKFEYECQAGTLQIDNKCQLGTVKIGTKSMPILPVPNDTLQTENTKIVKENLDVTQGKLIIGLNAPSKNRFATSMYNMVLGGGANSKLFQNVREKESLAYSAGSSYVRRKDAIFIKAGIEIQNYDKALKVIQKQLEDMKNGNITDDEIKYAKELIIESLKAVPESQEDTIAFMYDQSLFEEKLSIDEYIKNLQAITKDQIIEVAQKVSINTIYYLTK